MRAQSSPFQLSFNRLLRVDFRGSRVTSDGGLILVRELDERFGLSELIEDHLADSRTGRNTQFPLADRLRPSVYSRLAGIRTVAEANQFLRQRYLPEMNRKFAGPAAARGHAFVPGGGART